MEKDRNFLWLSAIDRSFFQNDQIKSCFSVFAESKGILVIFTASDVVSLKLVVTGDPESPLELEDIVRIDEIEGSTGVCDDKNSFLLSNDGQIFAFKSFKKIYELPERYTNIRLLECFKSTCYALLYQKDHVMKLQLFKSIGNEHDEVLREFDLSYPDNPLFLVPDDDEFCVEMIEGPLDTADRKFFNEFFALDLQQESIEDVLLMSFNDKLIWLRYENSFTTDDGKDGVLEEIAIQKGIIKSIKYCNGVLMVLDNRWTLTTYTLCPTTNLIRKREELLEGKVRCFRFHGSTLIYSNLKKVLFLDASKPEKMTTQIIELKGIVSFTPVENLGFIIAICYNRMFYHLSLHPKPPRSKNVDEFEILSDSEIADIPSVARYLERQENELLKIEESIKDAEKLRTFLQYVTGHPDFKAGEASIKFHRIYPGATDETIVCKPSSHPTTTFIELSIIFPKILESMSFKIVFQRFTCCKTTTRAVKITNAKDRAHILLPTEKTDKPGNKMKIDLSFTYDTNGNTELLIFPITITSVVPYDGPVYEPPDELDTCIEIINKMKM